MTTYNTNSSTTDLEHNHADHSNHHGSADTFNYTPGETHDFAAHADAMLGNDVLAPGQDQYGGYAFLGDSTIIARSPITGLRPVIEQAIRQIVGNRTVEEAAQRYGGNEQLESKIAQQLTNLNDWKQLQQETQNEIMISTGINFDAMTAAEQEMSINHLQHSPLPFGDIAEVLSTSVKIDMGYTHTLDKAKTEVEDLGDGVWKITMISNNNNGSHTGHNLGSFKINLGENADEAIATQIGNSMVVNTNNNAKLYLDQAARDVLYGNTEKMDYDHPEHDHSSSPGAGHSFVEHVQSMYGTTLIEGQESTGGYAYLSDDYIVGRSTITGMKAVVEQAITQVTTAKPNLLGEALEQAVAQQITNLNDWTQLTEATQAKIMIETGINFDGMTTAEQETTINHLLHSPLPFGSIQEVLSQSVKIDLGFTHTLDENKTTAEHLGDGIYEVSMISNNNNGSHTGHNLGSFKIDLSYLPGKGQMAETATASSQYNTAKYKASSATGEANGNSWLASKTDVGLQTLELTYANTVNASGVKISEQHSTGFVTKVEVQDQNGDYHTVWAGTDTTTGTKGDFVVAFDNTDIETDTVRITVDTNHARGKWEGIDAVELLTNDNDGSGHETDAIAIGNNMVVNTNNNAKLYLDQAARDVLYGNVEASDYTMDNPYQNAGDGHEHGEEVANTGDETGGNTGDLNHVHGTAGDDYLEGTDGNDHMMGGAGLDVFRSSAGSDTIMGGTGDYNQVDYEGSSSDYTFKTNDDSTVTVTKPNGTDTLSDIDGVWFLEESAWYSMDQLTSASEETGGGEETGGETATNVIEGTNGGDFLFGTSDDDLINLGDGLDVVNGSAGNDTINGGAGYNQVDYDGNATDYTFASNDDGTVTVVKSDGTDTLSDIGGVWFKGSSEWFSMEDLLGGTDTQSATAGTAGDDYILGTDANDSIDGGAGLDVIRSSTGSDTIDGGGEEYDQVDYEGSQSDYVFAQNDDGSIRATASNGDVDILIDIDGIWFEGDDHWVDIDEVA